MKVMDSVLERRLERLTMPLAIVLPCWPLLLLPQPYTTELALMAAGSGATAAARLPASASDRFKEPVTTAGANETTGGAAVQTGVATVCGA